MIIIGFIFCGGAIRGFKMRFSKNKKYPHALELMKDVFGEKVVLILHYFGHILFPLFLGLKMIIDGIGGKSIVDFLK